MHRTCDRSRLTVDQLRKFKMLLNDVQSLGSAIVAFSGGVDSATLLAVSLEALGEDAVAFTAVSPSLAARERAACVAIATELGANHIMRGTFELANPEYTENPTNRCYFCKVALFDALKSVKRELEIDNVLLGTNLDDLGDHRPGIAAARERRGLSPFVGAGLTKEDVRAVARGYGLSVADKPAMACLSSRFPYGIAITEARLDQVAQCEELLADLGFTQSRARYHNEVVRIELPTSELHRALEPEINARIIEGAKAAGFTFVTLDLEGFRSGSLNHALDIPDGTK